MHCSLTQGTPRGGTVLTPQHQSEAAVVIALFTTAAAVAVGVAIMAPPTGSSTHCPPAFLLDGAQTGVPGRRDRRPDAAQHPAPSDATQDGVVTIATSREAVL